MLVADHGAITVADAYAFPGGHAEGHPVHDEYGGRHRVPGHRDLQRLPSLGHPQPHALAGRDAHFVGNPCIHSQPMYP